MGTNGLTGGGRSGRGQEEERRAAALAGYRVLDTEPEAEFDDIVRLAAFICRVPIAAVSFLDGDRQWFKAELGLGVQETEIEAAFCAHAAAGGQEVFVVEDAAVDPRFAGNRLVRGEPGIRFYAGAPMRTAAGVPLGTVCVIDRTPRQLTGQQREALQALSRQAVALLEARRAAAALGAAAAGRESALVHAADSARRANAIFRHAAVGLLLVGMDGTVQDANRMFAAMLGRHRRELIGTSFRDLTAPDDVPAEVEVLDQLAGGVTPSVVREKRYQHRDGQLLTAVTTSTLIRTESGAPAAVLSQVQSIAEQRRAEEGLLETQSGTDAIISIDAAGRITAWNTGAERVFGYSRSQALNRPVTLIIPAGFHDVHPTAATRPAADRPLPAGDGTLALTGRRADGAEFPIEVSLSSWTRGGHRYSTAIVRDVSERHRHQAELLAQASTDPLTGVGNRSWFTSLVAASLTDPDTSPVSVLTVDLDGFTAVNDSLGPAAGDRVLIQVARYLAAGLRPGDQLARTGGDGFAVLLPGTTRAHALAVADRLRAALPGQVSARGVPVSVGCCVGVATHRGRITPRRAVTVATGVLRNAALALGAARAAGPGQVRVYQPALHTGARRRLTLHAALRRAVETGGLTLHYQPQVHLHGGRLHGVEALARWSHPTFGPVSPTEFIPLAEDTGLAPALGAWALHQACSQAAQWQHRRPRGVHVSVNVSGRQLTDDTIIDTVRNVLAATSIDPTLLTLEITESVLMTDPAGVARRLTALRALGVRTAVDDFGTGYSSLSSLTSFPVDELKIDRSFITPLPDDPAAHRVAAAIVTLAGSLRLDTVAEGIETRAQHTALTALGCTLGQGYLYSRPLPASQLTPWLTAPLRALPAPA